MKRAIFKFGESAKVRSFADVPFEVTIGREWLNRDGWDPLPMEILPVDAFPGRGTAVEVRDLYPHVLAEFGRDSFVSEMRDAIARQYSIILDKGFSVSVSADFGQDARGEAPAVEPERFLLLATTGAGAPRLAPYVYRGTIDGVDVEIYAGLYRQLPDEAEQDREQETSGSADDAGWIVACNDRVVI